MNSVDITQIVNVVVGLGIFIHIVPATSVVTISELKAHLKENREKLLQQIRDRKYKPQPEKELKSKKIMGRNDN